MSEQHTVYFLGGPADGTTQVMFEPLPPHFKARQVQMPLQLDDKGMQKTVDTLYALHNFRGLYAYAPAGEPMHLILSRIFEFYCDEKRKRAQRA